MLRSPWSVLSGLVLLTLAAPAAAKPPRVLYDRSWKAGDPAFEPWRNDQSAMSYDATGHLVMETFYDTRQWNFLVDRKVDLSVEEFTIEAEVEQRASTGKWEAWALMYGVDNGGFDDYESIWLDSAGQFAIGGPQAGQWKTQVEWVKAPGDAVARGKAVNKVRVVRNGDKVSYFANDKLLSTQPFRPGRGQRIGFAVGGRASIQVRGLRVTSTGRVPAPPPQKGLRVAYDKPWRAGSPAITPYKNDGSSLAWAESGHARLEGYTDGTWIHYVDSGGPDLSVADYAVEATVRGGTTADRWGAYGIQWNTQNDGFAGVRLFAIDNKNAFTYSAINGGQWRVVIDWTPLPGPPPPDGAPRQLRVERRGDRLSFYVDGHYVGEAPGEAPAGSRLGMVISGRASVELMGLRVSVVPPPPPPPVHKTTPLLSGWFFEPARDNRWSVQTRSGKPTTIEFLKSEPDGREVALTLTIHPITAGYDKVNVCKRDDYRGKRFADFPRPSRVADFDLLGRDEFGLFDFQVSRVELDGDRTTRASACGYAGRQGWLTTLDARSSSPVAPEVLLEDIDSVLRRVGFPR